MQHLSIHRTAFNHDNGKGEAKGTAEGGAKGLDIGGMSGPISEKEEKEKRRRKWAEDLIRLQEIKMKRHAEAGPTQLAAQQQWEEAIHAETCRELQERSLQMQQLAIHRTNDTSRPGTHTLPTATGYEVD